MGFFSPAPTPNRIMEHTGQFNQSVFGLLGPGVRNRAGRGEPAGYDFHNGQMGRYFEQWRESHQIKQVLFTSRPGKKASRMDIVRLRSSVPPGADWN